MNDRRVLVGRRYEVTGLKVDADASATYSAVIGDNNSRAGSEFASPFYAVALIAPLWRAIYQNPELGTEDQRVLHAEQRMLVHRDIRIGETLTGRALVADVVGFGFNDAAVIRCRLTDHVGAPVISMESVLAIQGSSGYPPAPRRSASPSKGPLAAQIRQQFPENITSRYADVADDHNPLHLDDEAAQAAGHPGRIVHGMCTLATGVSALVQTLGTPKGSRLSYIRARFSRPVLPGDTVEYTAHSTRAEDTYIAGANLDGRPVLKSCLLHLTSRQQRIRPSERLTFTRQGVPIP